MGIRISTNTQSIAATRHLNESRQTHGHAVEQLASGSRIIGAGDDAAGLSISESLRARIGSQRQAVRNTQDGVSMVQTVEGALAETSNILTRLRELSIQAASDTTGEVGRGMIDRETQQLKSEIDRIAGATEFNGKHPFDGSMAPLEIQVGVDKSASAVIRIESKDMVQSTQALGLMGISTKTKEDAQFSLFKIDYALEQVSESRATFGAVQNRLESAVQSGEIMGENLSTANSRIRDTDVAASAAEQTRSSIMMQSGVSLLSQANVSPEMALKLL